MILRNTRAEINLTHLTHNYKLLKSIHGRKFFCPMVKANAYGHGDIQVAEKLVTLGCEYLGVVLVEEGIRLRKNGVKNNILVFGTYTIESLEVLLEHNLTPVISGFDQLELLAEVAKSKILKIHIKFNTGMNRLGFDPTEAAAVSEKLKNLNNLKLEGVCTHFLNAEDSDQKEGFTEQQYKTFQGIKTIFAGQSEYFHCLNSAGLILNFHNKKDPSKSANDFGARPGISLYGIKPTLVQNHRIDLRPVMSLKSYIGQIHEVKKNQTVSYGGTWNADRDTLIATIPIGYADGYFRAFSNQTEMLFRRKRVPVRGIVCMDYTMIDVTPLKNEKAIEVGEDIVIFGEQDGASLHSYELANKINMSPYEVVTRISNRVPRVYFE